MASFVEQMGNIEFLMLAIGGVVFFTLLLVTGNTMAMSVRERTGELAVLKTVGFGDRFVLVLVLAESLLDRRGGRRPRHRPGQGSSRWAATPPAACWPASTCRRWAIAAGLALALAVGLLAGLHPGAGRPCACRSSRRCARL